MIIQHNIAALNSYRQLSTNNNAISKNLEKLSSGYKINRAGDDAAGLAISEKMRAQITGLEKAQDNANDGISLVQTAEGALTEVHDMLNRMVELATQSANGTYDDETDRANLQKEVTSLKDEIDRISKSTNFNGINLLDGSDLNGTAATEATKATFTLDLAGAAITGGATSMTASDTLKITIGGQTIESNAAKGGESTAEQLAGLFDGTEYTDAAGKKYDVTVSGTTLTLTAQDAGQLTAPTKGTSFTLGQGNTFAGGGTVGAPTTATVADATNGADAAEATGGLTLQIGDTADDFNQIKVIVGKMDTEALDIDDIDISTAAGADAAIDKIKKAINTVSSTRGDLGAIQNRLEHTINNLGVTTENITSAESRIRDTDMAEEMMAYTKNNILVQASQAMLAQANTLPQGVLQLLQ